VNRPWEIQKGKTERDNGQLTEGWGKRAVFWGTAKEINEPLGKLWEKQTDANKRGGGADGKAVVLESGVLFMNKSRGTAMLPRAKDVF